ncbi:hypothetical protein I2I05_08500 [Hymenobacter sp. BT683]|uniref:Tail fiber protein n=1 Tax=Hymenobacter jeongseonensis TaxID=2791027 RepID=A0ABS0IGF4_9BACT|nr:hypothetical protein [Hymenobacter jeongseonensis]MBF9237436.1 hypothetical protein [Hymenobacter jeongseonensis]
MTVPAPVVPATTLPIATADELGVVKIGTGLTISIDGTLSIMAGTGGGGTVQNSLSPASTTAAPSVDAVNAALINKASTTYVATEIGALQTSISTKADAGATTTALNGKENAIASSSSDKYWRGDKTFQILDKTAVGLSNVNNTADFDKPMSNAALIAFYSTSDALFLKADKDSPIFTGTPTAPTQTAGNSSTRIATTAFVTTAINLKANVASPALTGTPTAPTATAGTNTTQLATTAFVTAAVTAGGGGGSVQNSLTPASTTAAPSVDAVNGAITTINTTTGVLTSLTTTNKTNLVAAINEVKAAVGSGGGGGVTDNSVYTAAIVDAAVTTAKLAPNAVTSTIIVDGAVTTAKIANNISLTGLPTAPTQTAGNSSTRIATTAFVTGAVATLATTVETIRATTTITASKSANYTLALADAGNIIPFTAAATVTIPLGVFAPGTVMEIAQEGAGQVTVVGASGVTVFSFSGFKTAGQWASVGLRQRAANEWVITNAVV